ncbi:MAG: PAS domain-containing protein [Ferrovibrio sp.]|uniref:PAS domain-containing protein n=1 Tax=Ferrovibrio sp. TaxID=1917215 RepID=UPI00261CE43D|nr:PAS domain-containing protein [Ferrovibrio sp.]MCW0233796.1 PAS domain-containing protein [Ferrovibrio sp.]
MDFRHPPLQQFYAYWEGKRQDGALPFRDTVDPLDLRFVLGHVLLAEVVRGDSIRFRYRLWGSRLTEDYGAEMTGRFVDELQPAAFGARVHRQYLNVVEACAAQHEQFDDVIDGRWFIHERLLLPLALREAPDRVGIVMGAIFRSPRLPP